MKKRFNKIKKFVVEEYKFLIICFIILFLGLFRLPYNLYVGGGIISLEKRMEVENAYETKGSLNISYVRSLRATIPSYLLSYVFDWERESIENVKIDSEDNAKEMWAREKIYLQEANDNAIISAYKLADEEINIKNELLKVLYVDKDSEVDLKTGDIILSIDGIKINTNSDLEKILENKNIGDILKVEYNRSGKIDNGNVKVREIDGKKKLGIYIIKMYEYDTKRKVTLDFADREGGSSAGFMLSLAIYNKLTPFDLTKGRKIVGTGTIDSFGNVGEIGGVKYKLAGAVSSDADIFLVPTGNYEEAMKEKKENNYDIDIVEVKTLSDAVEYLTR